MVDAINATGVNLESVIWTLFWVDVIKNTLSTVAIFAGTAGAIYGAYIFVKD